MTVKGHITRLPMKRYHKSLVFLPPYPLALQCKLEFLLHSVIASIGHIGGLRHTHTHTHKVKFAMLSASEARSLECQVKWAPTLDCSPRLSSAFCSALAFAQPNPPWPFVSAILPLQRAKGEWDAQTRWSVVLWKLVKTKPIICSLNLHTFKVTSSGDVEQHPSWSPPSFAFDGFPWSCTCTIIDETLSMDSPSQYYHTICSPTE